MEHTSRSCRLGYWIQQQIWLPVDYKNSTSQSLYLMYRYDHGLSLEYGNWASTIFHSSWCGSYFNANSTYCLFFRGVDRLALFNVRSIDFDNSSILSEDGWNKWTSKSCNDSYTSTSSYHVFCFLLIINNIIHIYISQFQL